MQVIGRIVTNVKCFYGEINPKTLSGAIDVIVIEQPDGSLICSPFHVKFGVIEVMRARDKEVDIYLNGDLVDLRMELAEQGDGVFIKNGPCNCSTCQSCVNEQVGINQNITENQQTKSILHSSQPLSDSEVILCQLQNKSSFPLSENEYTNYYVTSQNTLSKEQTTSNKHKISSNTPAHESCSKEIDIEKTDVFDKDVSLLPKPAFQDFKVELSLCGGLCTTIKIPDNFDKHIVSFTDFISDPSIINKPNLVIKINNKFYNWSIAAPMILSYIAFNSFLPSDTLRKLRHEHLPKKKHGWFYWRKNVEELSEEEKNQESSISSINNEQNKSLPIEKTNTHNTIRKSASFGIESTINTTLIDKIGSTKDLCEIFSVGCASKMCFRRSKLLSSYELKSLKLNPGPNNLLFSVTTRYQGTVTCHARIFLWNYKDKIIVSDVDGTITKSDVLGMLMPLVGKDWTHEGVVKLFTLIHNNGYKIAYLSARTYGIANQTRNYLENIIMDKLKLPLGPILLSPSSLIEALHREVVEKKPEVFKIDCLQTITKLFPSKSNPLVSGFGNRINDSRAYIEVGIPKSKIFLINSKGQITQESNKSYLSTYSTMAEFVDFIFPFIDSNKNCDFHLNEYNDFYYWRRPYINK